MSVHQIFDEALNMIHDAYAMILTEIADGNYTLDDLEFIAPDIEEFIGDFTVLDESIIEEISKCWIGEVSVKSKD